VVWLTAHRAELKLSYTPLHLFSYIMSGGAPPPYPLSVQYCGVCGLPPELCSYGPKYALCFPWLQKHAPQFAVEALSKGVGEVSLGAGDSGGGGGGGGAGSAGGGGGGGGGGGSGEGAAPPPPAKEEKKAAVKKVVVTVKDEGKRTLTTIVGLEPYCTKLKEAGSTLAKKVGAGSSVKPSAANPTIQEIVVQGDMSDTVEDLLVTLFKVRGRGGCAQGNLYWHAVLLSCPFRCHPLLPPMPRFSPPQIKHTTITLPFLQQVPRGVITFKDTR
jgi:density-regulated protein DRP1